MNVVLSLLAQGMSLGFAACVSPGPFLAFLISETLAHGWRHTAPLLISPLVSDAPVILVTVFILGQLPPTMLSIIQILGGLFILYLAWTTLQQLRSGKSIRLASDQAPPVRHIMWRGVAINVFSPGVWIFWSTINGPIVVGTWRTSPPAALAYLLGFYTVLVGGMAVWITVFHMARRLDERVVRGLLMASVVIMAIFGLILLKSGLFG